MKHSSRVERLEKFKFSRLFLYLFCLGSLWMISGLHRIHKDYVYITSMCDVILEFLEFLSAKHNYLWDCV